MLRGLNSRPRAPASDEVHQHLVRLRQAQSPLDFIARQRRKLPCQQLLFSSIEKEKVKKWCILRRAQTCAESLRRGFWVSIRWQEFFLDTVHTIM